MNESPTQPVESPPRRLKWHEDPARRADHLQKLADGRARKREETASAPPEPSAAAPVEGEPNYPDLMRSLRAIRWDRIELSVGEGLMGVLEQTRTEGIGRLQIRRERESANRCSYCGDPFPSGRHYEQLTWTDLDSQRIVSRLSCAKLTCRSRMREEHDRERRKRVG